MKKILLSQNYNLIQIAIILALCTWIILAFASTAKADAAPPPDPTVGGVGPYQPLKTNIQMMSEDVFIEVPPSPSNLQEPKQIRVNAGFTMRNQGENEEKMQVIFPLTRLNTGGSEEALYQIDTSSFVAKVNGQPVPFTTITTPPESTASDMEHGFSPNVQWAAFEVSFPVKQDVLLQVDYEMLNPYGEYGEGFTGVAYILETGAGWYGKILSADITLHLPFPVTEEAISQVNSGYIISGNELHWKLKNFEPTRQDNIEVRVIHADLWKSILDLRSKTNQNPDDVDAWVSLGNRYMGLGIYMREGIISEIDPHFTELAIEARQKVVELRPEWGDAHYKLAEILWLSNPSIKNALRMGGESTAPEPSLDDPAIQQILHELQLAWSLGATDSLPYLNRVFPQLVITEDSITTVKVTSPIITLAPVATNTTLPTFPPTLTPTVSPTSTPVPIEPTSSTNNNILLIMVIGLIIICGVFVYQWKSKLKA
jgi:hypothetical protein